MSGLLLEREAETADVMRAIAAAREGRGAMVFVEGAAGIGKSALVELAASLARDAQVEVLLARPGVLERRYAYGVVRHLLSAALGQALGAGNPELLSGSAGQAWRALAEMDARAPDEGTLMYGLYWLVVKLSERAPRALLVDDAHWADAESLRFLAFLARRLEGLAVAVIVAARRGDPDAPQELLDGLAAAPGAVLLRPAELSTEALATLIAAALGVAPVPDFVHACHDATRGNPFLLGELLAALRRDGVTPGAAAAEQVGELSVPAIGRAVLMRIGRLPQDAVTLARAVAVLGDGADPRTAFALAGLSDRQGTQAAEALLAADVVRSTRPLVFGHPLVRDAVYRDLSAVSRASLHGRAAALLVATGADTERVAAQLLEAPPSHCPEDVDVLRAAARTSRSRGSPQAAAAYLHRALMEEPEGAQRTELLRELASAEVVLRRPGAEERLEAALAATSDVRQRGLIAMQLASVLMYGGQSDSAETVLEAAIDALGEDHEDLVLRLQTMWGNANLDGSRDDAEPTRIAALRRSAEREADAALPLRVYLAFRGAMAAQPSGAVLELLRRGWCHGRLLENETGHSPSLDFVMLAATWIEELDWAVEVCDAVFEDARRSGSVMAFCSASAHRALALLARGDVERAEADARSGLDLATEHRLGFTLPYFGAFLGDVLMARGTTSEAEDVLAAAVAASVPGTIGAATVLTSRGWLRLGQARRGDAAADLREAGRIHDERGVISPAVSRWRRGLALAIAPERPDAAQALLATDLQLARRAAVPGVTAHVLRAGALTARGEDQVAQLEQARATADTSNSLLTRAQLDLDLGAALRRTGRRRDAREPLRRGLDLAARCGAHGIGEQARHELEATGARPRRERITGRDALTASEHRISAMAAGGLTNREIAERLFLTPKTVENHLGRVYTKLGISSRRDVEAALARN